MKLAAAIAGAALFYLGCYVLTARYGVLWLVAAVLTITAVLGLAR